MDSNIYLIFDKISGRVATPMFMPNHASAVRECATMLARLDPMALNDFELYFVGTFSSECEDEASIFDSISLLDSSQVENLSSRVHEYFARFNKNYKGVIHEKENG